MTFGLKNVGATYQKAFQKCLQGQIGRNTEAYVDDVIIKTRSNDQFIADLQETFENLKRFKWKLVVVLQTTAGWRKAPALAQRVCTQGVASLRSIFLKNTRNTAGFRVVRAAGA